MNDGEGVLGHFGLCEWFYSLPKEDQDNIKYYTSQWMNFDSTSLFEGRIFRTTNTATKLVSNLALSALQNKNHDLSEKLLKKASDLIKTDADRAHYQAIANRIAQEREFIPDQKVIDSYKEKVLKIISEHHGILQTEVKNHFEANKETIVGHALSQLKYEGKIRREKKGVTFKLCIF